MVAGFSAYAGLLDEVGWMEGEILQEKEILKEQVGQVSMNVAY